jgi:hypothetical protein
MPAPAAARADKLLGGAGTTPAMEGGLDPAIVGEMVRRGIVENRAYIFSHPEFEPTVRSRFENILEDFAWAQAARRSG